MRYSSPRPATWTKAPSAASCDGATGGVHRVVVDVHRDAAPGLLVAAAGTGGCAGGWPSTGPGWPGRRWSPSWAAVPPGEPDVVRAGAAPPTARRCRAGSRPGCSSWSRCRRRSRGRAGGRSTVQEGPGRRQAGGVGVAEGLHVEVDRVADAQAERVELGDRVVGGGDFPARRPGPGRSGSGRRLQEACRPTYVGIERPALRDGLGHPVGGQVGLRAPAAGTADVHVGRLVGRGGEPGGHRGERLRGAGVEAEAAEHGVGRRPGGCAGCRRGARAASPCCWLRRRSARRRARRGR